MKIDALRVIMLAGASTYLLLMSVVMVAISKGQMVWHPDFLLLHGEPFLVGLIAVWCGVEAFIMARKLK